MHEIIPTEDGSSTLYVPQLDEHYHSVHGAIQESRHIFLHAGMEYFLETFPERVTSSSPLHILEAGFGTGLNAYLTLIRAGELQCPVCYHTIEKYPLTTEEISRLNYPENIGFPHSGLFYRLHDCPWEKEQQITSDFRFLQNTGQDFREIHFPRTVPSCLFRCFQPGRTTSFMDDRSFYPILPGHASGKPVSDLLRQRHSKTSLANSRVYTQTPPRSTG